MTKRGKTASRANDKPEAGGLRMYELLILIGFFVSVVLFRLAVLRGYPWKPK